MALFANNEQGSGAPLKITSAQQKRKRLPRVSMACEMCRAQKAKCDQNRPCSHCTQHKYNCVFVEKEKVNDAKPPKPFKRNNRKLLKGQNPTSVVTNEGNQEQPSRKTARSEPLSASAQSSSLAIAPRSCVPTPDRDVQEAEFVPDRELDGVLRSELRPFPSPVPQEVGGRYETRHQEIRQDNLPPRNRTNFQSDELTSTQRLDQEDSDAVRYVNSGPSGTGFFGPSSAIPFLSQLLSRARSSQRLVDGHKSNVSEIQGDQRASIQELERISRESFLRTSDEPSISGVQSPTDVGFSLNTSQSDVSYVDASQQYLETNTPTEGSGRRYQEIQIEKECIKLYFNNLHLIHPILSELSFVARCETEIWSNVDKEFPGPRSHHQHSPSKFLALYYAVLAVGAITAGDNSVIVYSQSYGHLPSQMATNERWSTLQTSKFRFPPLRLARIFFERAKVNLGDVFEICTIEGTQALFLMSVFCQNALKPHSSYMYSGMAVRTALAIGLTNEERSDSDSHRDVSRNLWWCIYAHEMEMCCSCGRDTLLKPPNHYQWIHPDRMNISHGPLALDGSTRHYAGKKSSPRDSESRPTPTVIIEPMISFAEILRVASDELYHTAEQRSPLEISEAVWHLDGLLDDWKRSLPKCLDLNTTSIREPEWISKQKIVLNLRFWNAKIIVHRRFLITNAEENDGSSQSAHLESCLQAARETILLLHTTYFHRPYIRTWWYNTTYALYASVIILYAVLSNLVKDEEAKLLCDVEKSLEILNSMGSVILIRRCAELIQEVLDLTRTVANDRNNRYASSNQPTRYGQNMSGNFNAGQVSIGGASPSQNKQNFPVDGIDIDTFDSHFLSNMVDFNVLVDFASLADFSSLSCVTDNTSFHPAAFAQSLGDDGTYSRQKFDTGGVQRGDEDGMLYPSSSQDLFGPVDSSQA